MTSPRDKSKDRSNPFRVLLVEDNPGDARLIREAIKNDKLHHFEIYHAERVEDALKKLSEEKIDVILTDLGLPGVQGFEAMHRLQAAATNLPLVVLTSTGLEEHTGLEAVRQGAQDYLVKGEIEGNQVIRSLLYAIERKKAQLRSHFTSIVTHELRTPLSVIKEAISMVLEGQDGSCTPGQRENLELAKSNVDRLERLIGNVLNFSRLEAGRMECDLRPVDVGKTVREIYQFEGLRVKKKGLGFRLECPEKPIFALCDEDQIRQVLINLLDNAIKFTDKGAIHLRLAKADREVFFEVEDTGAGIPLEDQPRIFEFFVQGSYEGKAGGLGLGLAICKHLLDCQGGNIALKSLPGHGSKFTVSLPQVAA